MTKPIRTVTPRRLRAVTRFLALGVACSGCTTDPDAPLETGGASGAGGSGASGGSGGSGGSGQSGNAGSDTLLGGITVKLIEANAATGASAYTSLLGKFQDGPQPPVIPLEVAEVDGDCELLVPSLPSCPAGCSGSACTEDDVCTPYPNAVNVGTIAVEGLGAAPFMMKPLTTAFAYQAPMTLPNPPCEEGTEVLAEAPAFSLSSPCVAQLELEIDEALAVREGEAVALSWAPPGVSGISHVHIVLDVAHHGGKKGEIVCNVADTGSFAIPEPLVTRLVNLGLAGFPTIVVSRVSGALGTEIPDVKLTVMSPLERSVNTGVVSCTEDADCPDGTTCQVELICG
jgi:hypothetical protein